MPRWPARPCAAPVAATPASHLRPIGPPQLSIIESIKQRATARDAVIAFAEPEDERIVQAAAQVAAASIARPVLVGPPEKLPRDLPEGVRAHPVTDPDQIARYAAHYARRRGVKESIARRLARRPLLHAAMMVAAGDADGMVAGCTCATASVLQAAGLAIGYAGGVSTPSSCFIMVIPHLRGADDLPLVFADCAVNVDPCAEELAATAVAAAGAARQLLEQTPRVAMLSFSTQGSAAHPKVDLVRRATELAAEAMTDGFVAGELQFDAAVAPEVAARKVTGDAEVAGRANVLIFPDLNSGNMAYKATQYLAGAQAIGPILLGFDRPVNDLSRGASVDDIVAITAVTVLQGQAP